MEAGERGKIGGLSSYDNRERRIESGGSSKVRIVALF
mgnify:CR=1 FL=1